MSREMGNWSCLEIESGKVGRYCNASSLIFVEVNTYTDSLK